MRPEQLDAAQRALYEAITSGPRGRDPGAAGGLVGADGALTGPFNAMLLTPALGARLQALGAAIRYESQLPPRCREIAILLVAREWRSDVEWHAHDQAGRAAGLTGAEIAAIGAGDDPGFTDESEQATARTARALASRRDLTDEEFAAAASALGDAAVTELIILVGYYALLALELRVLRVDAPAPGPWAAEGSGD